MKCPNCGVDLALHAVEPLGEQPRRADGSREPAGMTPARAAAFVVPLGKYRGLTLADVGERDPEYLRWGAGTWDRALGRAARFHLEQVEAVERLGPRR